MNRKRIALFTSLTLLTGIPINDTHLAKNRVMHTVKASESKRIAKVSSKYPDITQELDITSMEQYTSNNLFMNVTLKKFYIKDLSTNKQGQILIILAPLKTSNQYFYLQTDLISQAKINQKITVQGFLNGKTKLTNKQIDDGLNPKYLNKKVVSIMPDKIILN